MFVKLLSWFSFFYFVADGFVYEGGSNNDGTSTTNETGLHSEFEQLEQKWIRKIFYENKRRVQSSKLKSKAEKNKILLDILGRWSGDINLHF